MTTTFATKKREETRPFFDEFFSTDPATTMTRRMNWLLDSHRPGRFPEYVLPALDLYNKNGSYFIEVALPGLDKKDVEVEIEGNCMAISGKYESEKEEEQKDKRYHYRELRRGQFSRTVTFPEEIDPARVAATFDRGILKVEIPSLRPAAPKKVAIK